MKHQFKRHAPLMCALESQTEDRVLHAVPFKRPFAEMHYKQKGPSRSNIQLIRDNPAQKGGRQLRQREEVAMVASSSEWLGSVPTQTENPHLMARMYPREVGSATQTVSVWLDRAYKCGGLISKSNRATELMCIIGSAGRELYMRMRFGIMI